jgi:hypothetical protein
MIGMTNAPFDVSKCPHCGGTGLEPIICCSGYECGCRGQPVDFKMCGWCDYPPVTEEMIFTWIPERMSK